MPGIIRKGDPATCGETAGPGSQNVFINNLGAIRCYIDTAGGLILPGPSNKKTIFVNNYPISIVGDTIISHGTGSHAAASLMNGSLDTLAYK